MRTNKENTARPESVASPRPSARTEAVAIDASERARAINTLLIAVVLAATLPLCAYMAYMLYSQSRDAQADAEALAQSAASAAAAWTRRELRTTEHLLRTLAERPEVRALERGRCQPLLRSLLPMMPQYANISVIDRSGDFVCSAIAPESGQRVPIHGGLRTAFTGGFGVSESLMGVLPRQYVVSAAQPVRDASGAIGAAITAPVDLAALRLTDEPAALPRGLRVRLVDGSGSVLASSVTGDRLGPSVFESELPRSTRQPARGILRATARGILRATARDGTQRIYAFAPIDGVSWRAVADVAAAELLAQEQIRTVTSIVLASAAFVLALLLAALIARHISRPLRGLRDAMTIGRLDANFRADVAGPREVRELARGLNEMIEAREAAVADLRASETRLKLAVAAAHLGIWDLDVPARTLYLSDGWKRQLGYAPDELPDATQAWETLLHPDERAAQVEHIERLLASREATYAGEFRLRARDGSYRRFRSHADIVRDDSGAAVRMIGANVDITDSRRMEDDLRELLARQRELSLALLEAEDRERRHIGRELHDRVGGNLSAMQLTAGAIDARVVRGDLDALPELVQDLRALIVATSAEVRSALAELRPPALDDFGLAAALRSHASSAVGRMGATLVFDDNGPLPRLRAPVETAFFRIAQEALTNIGKHADAHCVRIALEAAGGWLTMLIDDDGSGFDPDARTHGGAGLRGMRERADAVGATLSIESAPGVGTLVTVRAPLRIIAAVAENGASRLGRPVGRSAARASEG